MSRRSPFPSSPHSPNLYTATHSTSTSTTHHLPPSASSTMSEEDDNIPLPTSTSPLPPHTATSTALSLLPSPTSARTPLPIREDCWSEDATRTLVEAWGSHYIELNRGNLRQKQWKDIADAVNAVHAHTKKLRRTDIQCKNRIDTLKKKFKVEKTKFNESNGHYVSPWPFFPAIDSLLGDSFLKANPPRSKTRKRFASSVPASSLSPVRKDFLALPPPPSFVPVGPRSKRPSHGMFHSDDSRFQRKFQDMGVVTAMEGSGEDDDDDDEESETFFNGGSNGNNRRKMKRREEYEAVVTVEEGYGQLAEAFGRLGEIYERVEEAKQRQMVELEKQRMQFAKDLEIQRLKLFMESQLQLQKLKLSKSRSKADRYS